MLQNHTYLNGQISEMKSNGSLDTNLISDGLHTFGELYEHRITLFTVLVRLYAEIYGDYSAWRTRPRDGWFILGLKKTKGEQITYHLPESKWSETDFANDLEEGEYEFDGHTSADVLTRLKNL